MCGDGSNTGCAVWGEAISKEASARVFWAVVFVLERLISVRSWTRPLAAVCRLRLRFCESYCSTVFNYSEQTATTDSYNYVKRLTRKKVTLLRVEIMRSCCRVCLSSGDQGEGG